MPRTDRLRVGVLYPDLLNIYADRGNLTFLQRRCEWRSIGFEVVDLKIGSEVDPDSVDLLYIGGGQDRDQALCANDLVTVKQQGVAAAVAGGTPLLAVCGGYQLLGRAYETADGEISGINLAGFTTVRSSQPRLVGPCAIRTDLPGPTGGVLAGFENHAGRTLLDDPKSALGTVIAGSGNDGNDSTEGFRDGNLIGTYLHGPLLPKNWWLADWLIAKALKREPEDLSKLEDSLEREAHRSALLACGIS